MRTGIKCGEGFGGRGHARQHHHVQRQGLRHHGGVEVGGHDQTAARSVHLFDLLHIQHRACADKALRKLLSQCGDALQRFGRVEWHLDDGKAAADQGLSDGRCFRRGEATQDGDQGQLGHGLRQGLSGGG